LAIPGTAELLAPVAEPEAQAEASKESEGAGSVVDAARRALRLQKNNPGYYQYSEEYDRSALESLFGGKLPITVDCSGFATLCYKAAGLPDPNGLGYKPLGNTTTLEAHGRATNNPQPGDLAFWSGAAHVAVYIGNGKVISMGTPGDPVEETVAAETAIHSGFVGYRTYGTSSAGTASSTKAAGDNILHAVSKRTAEADLRSLTERSPIESDLLDGLTWTTGR
jgi:cell wall-associated NlpC family hydrolase